MTEREKHYFISQHISSYLDYSRVLDDEASSEKSIGIVIGKYATTRNILRKFFGEDFVRMIEKKAKRID